MGLKIGDRVFLKFCLRDNEREREWVKEFML